MVICAYYLIGIIGLPVFAGGTSGINKILGASGGFLYGFLFSGLLISFLVDQSKSLAFSQLLIVFLAATVVLFIFGLGHLTFKFGIERALEYGLYPFWKMALVKALLATLLVFYSKPHLFQDN